MLQLALENTDVQDTVVISNWSDNTPTAKKEFDFLIISLPLKSIIHIEVKRTLDEKSKEKAIQQLDDGHSIISSKIPFQKESSWSYIQFICFSQLNDSNEEIGQFLKSHVPTIHISEWWKGLFSRIPKDQQTDDALALKRDAETYLSVLKYLFHQMFIQEDVLTQGKYVQFQ